MRKFRFNPTLVRLRLSMEEFKEFVERLFQSHAGSIEALRIAARLGDAVVVSIPRWFD